MVELIKETIKMASRLHKHKSSWMRNRLNAEIVSNSLKKLEKGLMELFSKQLIILMEL